MVVPFKDHWHAICDNHIKHLAPDAHFKDNRSLLLCHKSHKHLAPDAYFRQNKSLLLKGKELESLVRPGRLIPGESPPTQFQTIKTMINNNLQMAINQNTRHNKRKTEYQTKLLQPRHEHWSLPRWDKLALRSVPDTGLTPEPCWTDITPQ